jgi:hypothetical protein
LFAGITTALVTIPDAMASAILAGVNPLNGLYALMVGTPIAALLASSQFMFVANTGAIAITVNSVLHDVPSDQLVGALAMLTVMVGVFQLALGLLKAGGLVRYISNACNRVHDRRLSTSSWASWAPASTATTATKSCRRSIYWRTSIRSACRPPSSALLRSG